MLWHVQLCREHWLVKPSTPPLLKDVGCLDPGYARNVNPAVAEAHAKKRSRKYKKRFTDSKVAWTCAHCPMSETNPACSCSDMGIEQDVWVVWRREEDSRTMLGRSSALAAPCSCAVSSAVRREPRT